jgi:hypothetical protein
VRVSRAVGRAVDAVHAAGAKRWLRAHGARQLPLAASDRKVMLGDVSGKIGFDCKDLFQTAWAARVLARTRPKEHVGLGGYGEPVDYDGNLLAAAKLARVFAPGVCMPMLVPLGGVAHIQFYTHQTDSHERVVRMFPELRLDAFAVIPESAGDGDLVVDSPASLLERERSGRGCFEFERPADR